MPFQCRKARIGFVNHGAVRCSGGHHADHGAR